MTNGYAGRLSKKKDPDPVSIRTWPGLQGRSHVDEQHCYHFTIATMTAAILLYIIVHVLYPRPFKRSLRIIYNFCSDKVQFTTGWEWTSV